VTEVATRIANQFLVHLSNLLLLFGVGLLGLGLAVQVSRWVQMREIRSAEADVPRFEDTLRLSAGAEVGGRQVAPAMSPEPTLRPDQAAPPERLVIPAIDLDVPVVDVGWNARVVNGELQGNVWETADYAAGFHKASAPPGVVGNTVLSGHNNKRGEVFKALHKVGLGDRVTLYTTTGARHDYEVVESFVLREEDASLEERRDNTHWIRETPDERLTLVTCFPPWSNTHRLIVVAFPVADES
jgi:sortase A